MFNNEDAKPLKIILALLVLFLISAFIFFTSLYKDTMLFQDFLIPAIMIVVLASVKVLAVVFRGKAIMKRPKEKSMRSLNQTNIKKK